MRIKKDIYQLLGLSDNASADKVKKVFRDFAKRNHPDFFPKDKQREEKSNTELKHCCEMCNYKTDSLYNYLRHIEGKKHKQNLEKDWSKDDGFGKYC